MPKADLFKVQNNIVLAFQSKEHEYKMHLLIENGLIRLEDLTKGTEQILFLGDTESYTGEVVEPVQAIEEKPKKKKRSKKKK